MPAHHGQTHHAKSHTKPHAKSHVAAPAKRVRRKWSADVMAHSDALDLREGIFKGKPPEIARGLKRSAKQSHRRKSDPYRSAMSMLTFYINRAGHNLSAADRRRLEAAKDELRKIFGKETRTRH